MFLMKNSNVIYSQSLVRLPAQCLRANLSKKRPFLAYNHFEAEEWLSWLQMEFKYGNLTALRARLKIGYTYIYTRSLMFIISLQLSFYL